VRRAGPKAHATSTWIQPDARSLLAPGPEGSRKRCAAPGAQPATHTERGSMAERYQQESEVEAAPLED